MLGVRGVAPLGLERVGVVSGGAAKKWNLGAAEVIYRRSSDQCYVNAPVIILVAHHAKMFKLNKDSVEVTCGSFGWPNNGACLATTINYIVARASQ